MAVKVIDASAVAAIVFAESEGEAVAAGIENDFLVAPALLPFEVSVCIKKARRHPELRPSIFERFSLLHRFSIELREVDHRAVVRLADEAELSAYDASYLWLSHMLDAELVTLDRKLAFAARR